MASLGASGTGTVSFFYTPDGSQIIKVPTSGPPSLWDSEGKFLTNLGTEASETPAISPDGKRIVLQTQEGGSLWNEKGELLRRLPLDYSHNIAFSADGKHFLTKSGLWDREGDLIAVPFLLPEPRKKISEAVLSPNGKRMLVRRGIDNEVELWEGGPLPLEELHHLVTTGD